MHQVSPRTQTALISAFFLLTAGAGLTGSQAQAQQVAATTNVEPALAIPAGATMQVVLIRPVWAGTASPGASIYAQTTFPVTVGGKIAVPPGTFVEGRLEKVTRPARRSNRGELQILFTHIIFANGYVAALPGTAIGDPGPAAPAADGAQNSPADTLIAVAIQVSQRNDLLLDNGAQIEITLASPLMLNPQAVAAAIPLSRAPVPGQFRSASLCRPIPGSPGTSRNPGHSDPWLCRNPRHSDSRRAGNAGHRDPWDAGHAQHHNSRHAWHARVAGHTLPHSADRDFKYARPRSQQVRLRQSSCQAH